MPSNNLRNNELEFTPTFGTQQSIAYYMVIIDVKLNVVNNPGFIKGGEMRKNILLIVISGAISIAATIAKEAAKKAINAR